MTARERPPGATYGRDHDGRGPAARAACQDGTARSCQFPRRPRCSIVKRWSSRERPPNRAPAPTIAADHRAGGRAGGRDDPQIRSRAGHLDRAPVGAVLSVVDRLSLSVGRILADGDPRTVMASPEVRTVYLGQEPCELLAIAGASSFYGDFRPLRCAVGRGGRDGDDRANGAGKSTLLRMIVGCCPPATGTSIRGPLTRDGGVRPRRAGISRPRGLGIFPSLTVEENSHGTTGVPRGGWRA
jgi:hypothetical protein